MKFASSFAASTAPENNTTSRDDVIGLFHVLGKICYAKRYKPITDSPEKTKSGKPKRKPKAKAKPKKPETAQLAPELLADPNTRPDLLKKNTTLQNKFINY